MPAFDTYDGTRLAYTRFGYESPVICVPGGPGRAGGYLAGIAAAMPGRAPVVLDNRGTGASQVPADARGYALNRIVGDLAALQDHLGEDRIDVVAHSSAGNTALLYALRSPDRVRRLVLIAPSTRVAGIPVTGFTEALERRAAEPWYPVAREAIDRWAAEATVAGSMPYREAAAPFFYGRWDSAARGHAAGELSETALPAAEGFYADAASVDVAEVRAGLARLPVPVLVVTGELDPFPTPATGAALAALAPTGTHRVIAGCGHYPWIDDPAALAEVLAAHLHRAGLPAHD
ncbi:alpha/beta fold hydrolase [Salinispora arenicola]|uniref:alpha/beta fold hydrolase n=1 Tax=Salinispora arenicola TaxID=168697 RepID=UPI00036DF7ED|nr:alpha/beta hydrolase [Salinispora arenicola]